MAPGPAGETRGRKPGHGGPESCFGASHDARPASTGRAQGGGHLGLLKGCPPRRSRGLCGSTARGTLPAMDTPRNDGAAPVSPRDLVSFRAGDTLASELTRRRDRGPSPSLTVKRDGERYYELLACVREALPFDDDELALIGEVARRQQPPVRLLASALEEESRINPPLPGLRGAGAAGRDASAVSGRQARRAGAAPCAPRAARAPLACSPSWPACAASTRPSCMRSWTASSADTPVAPLATRAARSGRPRCIGV